MAYAVFIGKEEDVSIWLPFPGQVCLQATTVQPPGADQMGSLESQHSQ